MIDHLDLEVEVQTELMNIGLVIASVPIPDGDWSPSAWPRLMERMAGYLDVVDHALQNALNSLDSEDISMTRSPDIINICGGEALVSRSFRVSPPNMTKTLIIMAFSAPSDQG